ncbi:MAG: hypothetical protein ACR2LL_09515 [Nitrosopumilus sp.]|uniref:hypothetical protein n=1 Tax=Nitrosopumilus sp. TaxID=2024843 RepID=UPI00292D2E49|nr:hypothetical protein [Nitrosopumilus sp.]
MSEYSQSWKKKLRLQELVETTKKEIDSGNEFENISCKLDNEMQIRWRLVPSPRKNYLIMIKKILDNQIILAPRMLYL